VHVTSKPIIEDCKTLLFAPYGYTYEGVEAHFVEAKLDRQTNFWDQVEDFKWLKQTKSPNWDILPEEQRAASWEH